MRLEGGLGRFQQGLPGHKTSVAKLLKPSNCRVTRDLCRQASAAQQLPRDKALTPQGLPSPSVFLRLSTAPTSTVAIAMKTREVPGVGGLAAGAD